MTYFVRNGERVTGDVRTADVVVPYGNLALWSTPELAAIGVTVAEDPPPVINDAVVRFECKRRIYAVASQATQDNLNGYMNVLNALPSLSDAQKADVALFIQAMTWIAAMRATVPTLIGDPAYADDSKWPPLSDDLKAFAARF